MVIKVDLTNQDKGEKKDKSAYMPDKIKTKKTNLFTRMKSQLRIWQAKFTKLPLGHRILLLILILGIASLTGVAVVYAFVISTSPKREDLDTNFVLLEMQNLKSNLFSFELPEPPQVKDQQSPINGELFTKIEFDDLNKNKAMMVMIENTPDARPQAGLDEADLVYESLVESGITRYMAVFWSNNAKKLGPIRSVRTYFLDWSVEYDDPPIANIGQAGYAPDEAVIAPEADAKTYIIKYNVKSFDWYGGGVYFRDYERFKQGVSWEHVAYTDSNTLLEKATELGWDGPSDIQTWKFKKDTAKEKRPLTQTAEIYFLGLGSETYKVNWNYDQDSNTYKRSLGGSEHIDENTNKQIHTKNLILQYCTYRATGDKNGRILLGTIGEGNAKIFLDGKLIDGTWKKDTRTSRTRFYNQGGKEIQFNRGKIWIEIIPSAGGKALSTINID